MRGQDRQRVERYYSMAGILPVWNAAPVQELESDDQSSSESASEHPTWLYAPNDVIEGGDRIDPSSVLRYREASTPGRATNRSV